MRVDIPNDDWDMTEWVLSQEAAKNMYGLLCNDGVLLYVSNFNEQEVIELPGNWTI